MASFFSPALPRLDLPLARWTGVFFGALVLLLSYYAFRRRRQLAGAWRWALLFVAILLLQLVTRIPFLFHHHASLNSDRSVTLLMVENILEGTSRPIYFYGQLYQGSLDAYLYSLVHRWVALPALSVLVGNLFLLSVFVLCGTMLMQRTSRSSSFFYPLVIASLPVGAMLFLSMDRVHGFALVACLLGILMYLVFRSVFEEREGFLWTGFVAGLLFWSYQPSMTWIVTLFGWLFLSLMRSRRWAVLGKASWQTIVGIAVGALPHVLSEINNGLVNTRSFFFAPEPSAHLGMADAKAALAAVLRMDSNSPGGETAWYGVVFLSLCGLLVSLHRAVKERDPKWMYLPVIFGVSLGLLLLSGFPPLERYLVHYRVYGLFPVLLAALACKEIAFMDRRMVKGGVVVVFLLLTLGRSVAAHRRLVEPHVQEGATIEKLQAAGEKIILGDYWNTLRFAPFMRADHIITTAPSIRYPNAVLDASKYYPLALQLGEGWEHEDRGLISRHSNRRRIERLLQELDVGFSSEALDGYVLYSDFAGGLSAELSSLLVEGADAESHIRSGSYRALEERLAELPDPVFESGSIIIMPAPAEEVEQEPPPEGLRRGWQYVLETVGARITIPLDPMRSRRFSLPRSVGLEGGDYEAHLYYLGRSVHDYGRVEVSGAISDLVLSQIRDETTFVRPDAGEARSGLPINNGLTLTVRDEAIQGLELHVYSFFDFGSSIWTNRYDQVLLLDGKEIPLSYKENTIALPVTERRTIRMDTRYKTLLTARDSRGSPAFHNVGAVLERVTVHSVDSSYDFVPFLQEE